MKFSERFFKFPVRIYDTVSVKKVMKEQQEDEDSITIPAWIKGYARLPYTALSSLHYYDSFKVGRQIKDVRAEGFDMVGIYSPEFGEFECILPMKEFEESLNQFVEAYEKEYGDAEDNSTETK